MGREESVSEPGTHTIPGVFKKEIGVEQPAAVTMASKSNAIDCLEFLRQRLEPHSPVTGHDPCVIKGQGPTVTLDQLSCSSGICKGKEVSSVHHSLHSGVIMVTVAAGQHLQGDSVSQYLPKGTSRRD